jgi:hypothetical protein
VRSKRVSVLIAIFALAVVVTMTRPWLHGSQLVANRYAGQFSSAGFQYDGPFSASDDSFHQEFDAGGITGIHVETVAGEISVVTQQRDRVVIEGQYVAYGASEEIARERLQGVELNAARNGDIISVVGKALSDSAASQMARPVAAMTHVTIKVPPEMAVKVHTDVGDVLIEGLQAKSEVQTRVGNVEAKDINGDLAITTSVGNITVVDAAITHDLTLFTSMGDVKFAGSLGAGNRIETSMGNVNLSIPRAASINVDARSDMGKANTRLPGTLSKTKSSVVGVIGEGAPTDDLRVRAGMGNISITGK